jgi:hypothetical protein
MHSLGFSFPLNGLTKKTVQYAIYLNIFIKHINEPEQTQHEQTQLLLWEVSVIISVFVLPSL